VPEAGIVHFFAPRGSTKLKRTSADRHSTPSRLRRTHWRLLW